MLAIYATCHSSLSLCFPLNQISTSSILSKFIFRTISTEKGHCRNNSHAVVKHAFSKDKHTLPWPLKISSGSKIHGLGIFSQETIPSGTVLFSEHPFSNSQLTLNKKFVNACTNCLQLLNLQPDAIQPFVPARFGPLFAASRSDPHLNFQLGSIGRLCFCNSSCLDEYYMSYLILLCLEEQKDQFDHWINIKQALEERWDEYLPTLPLNLLFDVLAKEILLLNPNLHLFKQEVEAAKKPLMGLRKKNKISSYVAQSSTNKGHFSPPRSKITKKRLCVLEHFQPTARPFVELGHLFVETTAILNAWFSIYCPFIISLPLVEDTVRRLYNHCLYMVLSAPMTSENFLGHLMNCPSSELDSELKMLGETQESILAQGSGDLYILWAPVASGIYSKLAMMNHSCAANTSIQLKNKRAEIQVVTKRDIAKGEEVTRSYSEIVTTNQGGGGGGGSIDIYSKSVSNEDKQEKKVDTRKFLKEKYGFECQCSICRNAKATLSP